MGVTGGAGQFFYTAQIHQIVAHFSNVLRKMQVLVIGGDRGNPFTRLTSAKILPGGPDPVAPLLGRVVTWEKSCCRHTNNEHGAVSPSE